MRAARLFAVRRSGAAQELAGAYGSVVALTLGADGAVQAEGGRVWWAPGCPVRVVDTQGAGDTFLGVFAASLLARVPLEKALLRANVAAALSVEHHGSAQASFPGMEQVDEACPRQHVQLLAGG